MTPLRQLSLSWVAIMVIVAQLVFGLLPNDLERVVASTRDGLLSRRPSSSLSPQQVEAELAGHEPLQWEHLVTQDDLTRVYPYAPTSGIEYQAAKGLDKDMSLLQHDFEYIAKHPYRQLTQVEVRDALDVFMKTILDGTGWRKVRREEKAWPHDGRPSQADFEKFLEQATRRGLSFGMWPIEVGNRRYLMAQLLAQTPEFRAVHGFNTATSNHIYLGVWEEVGAPQSHIFQYLGAFNYPTPRRFHGFKKEVLKDSARGVNRIRMWGSSLMYVKFADEVRPPVHLDRPSK